MTRPHTPSGRTQTVPTFDGSRATVELNALLPAHECAPPLHECAPPTGAWQPNAACTRGSVKRWQYPLPFKWRLSRCVAGALGAHSEALPPHAADAST